MIGDLVSAGELEKRGIDGDEIDYSKGTDVFDEEKGAEERAKKADEQKTLVDAEREKFLDGIKNDCQDLIEADDDNSGYYVRRLNQVTGDYLYHEANNFTELIERKI